VEIYGNLSEKMENYQKNIGNLPEKNNGNLSEKTTEITQKKNNGNLPKI